MVNVIIANLAIVLVADGDLQHRKTGKRGSLAVVLHLASNTLFPKVDGILLGKITNS